MRILVLLLAVLLCACALPAQTPVHSVALAYDAASTPVPGGIYNMYRSPYDPVALTCGTFAKIGNTTALSLTDSTVVAGASYCYRVRYFDPSTSSESPVTEPDIPVGPIPSTLPLAQPKNLHVVKIQ